MHFTFKQEEHANTFTSVTERSVQRSNDNAFRILQFQKEENYTVYTEIDDSKIGTFLRANEESKLHWFWHETRRTRLCSATIQHNS
jgi:hypothetical protein